MGAHVRRLVKKGGLKVRPAGGPKKKGSNAGKTGKIGRTKK